MFVLISKIIVYPISYLSIFFLSFPRREALFPQRCMYAHWSRMHTGFCRYTRRSNVLSNLGANRSCDRLKIYTNRRSSLLPFPASSRLRHSALFCDNKNLSPVVFFASCILVLRSLTKSSIWFFLAYNRLPSIISLVFKSVISLHLLKQIAQFSV